MDRAFEADLVVLSGGVSAGKYDLVEAVLAEYDAEFFFTRLRFNRPTSSVRQSARKILLRSSRQSRIHDGDV